MPDYIKNNRCRLKEREQQPERQPLVRDDGTGTASVVGQRRWSAAWSTAVVSGGQRASWLNGMMIMLLIMQSLVTCNGGYRGWLYEDAVLPTTRRENERHMDDVMAVLAFGPCVCERSRTVALCGHEAYTNTRVHYPEWYRRA